MFADLLMNDVEADVSDDDESDDELPRQIGRPGRRPRRPLEDDVPSVDAVKTFVEAFFIVRDGATANTQPLRQVIEGAATPSVFQLFASVFTVCRVEANGKRIACSANAFGRILGEEGILPAGAQILDRQYVGVVDENDNIGPKRQRKVLTGGRFVSTEDELENCARVLLDAPVQVFTEEFVEIFANEDVGLREKTKMLRQMLKRLVTEKIERVRGELARKNGQPRARGIAVNVAGTQQNGSVARKDTRVVINDASVSIEMCAQFLRNERMENGEPRLREEDVESYAMLFRNPELVNAMKKQANAAFIDHPEWHITMEDKRKMLQRDVRAGVLETQIDAEHREDINSENEDAEMAAFADENVVDGAPISSQNKNYSQRQFSVLEDVANQFQFQNEEW